MAERQGADPLIGSDDYMRLIALKDERRFDEALVRARFLLERTDISLPVRARTHRTACWLFCEGLKRPCPEAVLHGEEAVRLFHALGDYQQECATQIQLAQAHVHMCEWAQAEACQRAALEILAVDPQAIPYGMIITQINLGFVYYAQDRFTDAHRAYDAAENACRGEDTLFLLHDVWRRRAMVLMKQGDIQGAARWLDRVDESLGPGSLTIWWKTVYRATRARLAVAQGDLEVARKYTQETLQLARELQDLPVMAECCCLLALIEQAEGRRDAWTRARAALNYAIASGRRDVVREVRTRVKPLLEAEEGI